MQREIHTELAISDLQRRLTILGYRLGDEAKKGLFGEKTAAAVASFKAFTGLGSDDVLDQTTWITIIDASMQMGDRVLHLHMPHLRGRDVGQMQGALSSMGFACTTDNVFGPETEQALRDFQENMGLSPRGILDDESLAALLRLRHIWEGKCGFTLDERIMPPARSLGALEHASVCFFGNDEPTRAIANRIANLARATTANTGIASAASLASVPGKDMLLIGLEQGKKGTSDPEEGARSEVPVVVLSKAADFEERFGKALIQARGAHNRLTLVLAENFAQTPDLVVEQLEIATFILDTLAKVLEESALQGH